jgi:FkbM family methyltransferase
MIRNVLGNYISLFPLLTRARNSVSKKFPSYFYFRSYSQWGEDSVISQFLNSKTGSYIDVGSGHPIKGNNTYFLYQRGWNGILIDPISNNSKLTKKYRPKDVFLQHIVSNEKGSMQFWEFKNYEFSTSDSVRASLLLKRGEILKVKYYAMSISLNDIIAKYYVSASKVPDLLSIDVEGFELQVLRSNNWDVFKPKVICIEILNNDLNNEVINGNHVFSFLASKGYKLRASVGNSQVFVKPD